MSSRKRSLHRSGLRAKRRNTYATVENLEPRLVLSQTSLVPANLAPLPTPPNALQPTTIPGKETPEGKPAYHAIPQYELLPPSLGGKAKQDGYLQGTGPGGGLSPQQLAGAYGAYDVYFGSVHANGAGQTIAVIDAGDNTSFADTGTAGYKGSSLQVFDSTFGIQDPPSFTKYNQAGGATLPAAISGWTTEIALDVEWAHSMAPDANIDLVEASTSSFTDLMQAANTAATKLGASVVSMSFGFDFDAVGESSYEQMLESTYVQTALKSNPDVTFLASAGDHGAAKSQYGIIAGPLYPSVSPNIVAVGGTTLNVTGTTWEGETGWSYDDPLPSWAGGGGYSAFNDPNPGPSGTPTFPAPADQVAAQTASGVNFGDRTTPDVSSDANGLTGVSVYTNGEWGVVGGTSLSSPTWAGFIAMADQGRVLFGAKTLDGPNETLPALYGIPSSDYHDITVGYNYFNAGPGYDLVTGRGSPVANKLIPDVAEYGLAAKLVVSTEPPSSVVQGGYFGVIASAETPTGQVVTSVEGTATLTLESGPTGATSAPINVSFNDGQAVFDGLTESELSSGTDYTFEISADFPTSGPVSATTAGVDVSTAATANVGEFYPLPVDSSMRADVALASSDGDATNNFELVYSAPYEVTQGQIVLQNNTSTPETINFIGGQQGSTSVIDGENASRLFMVQGTNGAAPSLSVVFQNLTLENGLASDDAGLGLAGNPSVGGALVVDGGLVTLSQVTLQGNKAGGIDGSAGKAGTNGGTAPIAGGGTGGNPGGKGTAGTNALGGAIYLARGVLQLTGDTIAGNTAQGGKGGTGGVGGSGGGPYGLTKFHEFYTKFNPYFAFSEAHRGAAGGAGGSGGSAAGGALYVAGGTVSLSNNTITNNEVLGGTGGVGGAGGTGGFEFSIIETGHGGGPGGVGGNGGPALGGGLYVAGGSLTLTGNTVSDNAAEVGLGGLGGQHGSAWLILDGFLTIAPDGPQAAGGTTGPAAGGGAYVSQGSLALSGENWTGNSAPSGGAVYNDVLGTLTVANSTFQNDMATLGNGGGFYNAGALNLQDVTISGSSATADGGGIANASTGKITLTSGSMLATDSAQDGGAISNAGTMTLSGAVVGGDDTASANGGGIYNEPLGTLTITGGTVTSNQAGGNGGGIANEGDLVVNGASLVSSSAAESGGELWNPGDATLEGSAVQYGSAGSAGGGIDNSGMLALYQSTVSHNGGASGGGISNATTGTALVQDSTIGANHAVSAGGGGIDS
jgi:hypothetical protein